LRFFARGQPPFWLSKMLNLKWSVKQLWKIVGNYFGYEKSRHDSDENADLLSAFHEFNSKRTSSCSLSTHMN